MFNHQLLTSMHTVWTMGREGVSEAGPRGWKKKRRNKKIRVTNIPNKTTHRDALNYFTKFGSVKKVHVTERNTCSVIFKEWEGLHAALACTLHVINGERVNVMPCSIPGKRPGGTENLGGRRNLATPPSACKRNCEKERGFRLFIRNVSPHWRKQRVGRYFSQFGDVISVYLRRSSTYGFVMFRNKAGMDAAAASTSHVLDGEMFQVTAHSEVRTARVSIEKIRTFDEKIIKSAMEKFGTIIHLQTFVSTRYGTVNPSLGYCAVTFSTHTEALRALDAQEVVMQGDTLQILPYGWLMGHEAKRSQKQIQQKEKVEEGEVRKMRVLWETYKECDGMEGDTRRNKMRRKDSMCDNNLPRPLSSSPVLSSHTSLAALPPSTCSTSNSQSRLPAERGKDAPNYYVEARQKVSSAFNAQVGVQSCSWVKRRKPLECCIS